MIMEDKIREKLEPKIREKSMHLRTFSFTKLYFGQKVSVTLVLPLFLCPLSSCPSQVRHWTWKIPPDLGRGTAPFLHVPARQPHLTALTP
jgi:hypothetical protein